MVSLIFSLVIPIGIAVCVAFFGFWHLVHDVDTLADFHPVGYKAPFPPPTTGVFAPNNALSGAEKLFVGQVHGPEALTIDSQGRIYMSCEDGFIKRTNKEGGIENFAHFDQRPLGIEFAPNGDLMVCVVEQGLFAVNEEGNVRLLTDTADGKKIKFADDVDISSDGVVYFSDFSTKYGYDRYMMDGLEGRPYGRLLSFDLTTNQTKVLLDGLYGANGVTLSSDEDFIAVAELNRYRIARYWLKGPKAGSRDILIENLPGLVDNIYSNKNGVIWVAMPVARTSLLDNGSNLIRHVLARLPPSLVMRAIDMRGLVLAVRETDGTPISMYLDQAGHLYQVTSAREINGFLYIGGLVSPFLARLRIGEATPHTNSAK